MGKMKTIVDFVANWYLWCIVPLALIAFVQGSVVVEGLLQGAGLHGYFVDGGKGDGSLPVLVSVWSAFVKAILSLCLTGVFLVVLLWHNRSKRAV